MARLDLFIPCIADRLLLPSEHTYQVDDIVFQY